MNQPTPAIVAQSAVRRLPRLALLLLSAAYVLPGFIGREPWKAADVTAFGFMAELAGDRAAWLSPTLLGQPPEVDALLPYWLGAWAMQLAPGWLVPDLAARIPFVALLALTLAATWYAVYYLARSPQAQPVPFAFGGEAQPVDYARAVADAALLALVACLGLAQLSHEATPALAQLAFTAVTFCGCAALAYRTIWPAVGLLAGLTGLALSGAPTMAVLFAAGAAGVAWLDARDSPGAARPPGQATLQRIQALLLLAVLATALLAWALELWRWRLDLPHEGGRNWRTDSRLLLWFTWPAWPLALWTLWRWRRQLGSRHVALPLWFVVVSVGTTLLTTSADRSLLLGLPALATLAAFALPTLSRTVSALIDWFTLLFFSGCALIIWVIWIAMQTGVPAKPAANVARLAPEFVPSFSLLAFAVALAATVAWGLLVHWRAGRHRAAIWKSLVLPAGGAALCWLLLMTLWLPLLDYARGYTPTVRQLAPLVGRPDCIESHRLDPAMVAALQYLGPYRIKPVAQVATCPWLLVDPTELDTLGPATDLMQWSFKTQVRHPRDRNETVLLYQRMPAAARDSSR